MINYKMNYYLFECKSLKYRQKFIMELLFHGNKEEKDSYQPQNSGDLKEGRWSNGIRKRQKETSAL